MRVGGRRQRRFRRDDLLAFMDEQGVKEKSEAPPITKNGKRAREVVLEDMTLERGDHLCSFYQADSGRLKLSVPFLADGLRKGEVCFLNAGAEARDHILEHLRGALVGVDAAIVGGRLVLSPGHSNGSEMFEYLEARFVAAQTAGGRPMRLVGDMVWALEQGIEIEDLMDFERRYNHGLARRFPIVSLCQYDTRRFSGTAIHEALMCHEDTFSYPLSRFL